MTIITEKIKNFLQEKNISQNELARRIDYRSGAFSNIVKGKRPFPDDIIQKIAPILEVSPETIRGWIIADKYPKDILKKALKIKQEHIKEYELTFIDRINKLMQENNLNITAFADTIDYNQGWLSQILLGKEPVSEILMRQVYKYSGIPEDEIKCWTVADKYSIEALQTALE